MAAEICFLKTMQRIPWMHGKMNQTVLQEVNETYKLIRETRELRYFGHAMNLDEHLVNLQT